ncbi:alpha/beta fold hydrolase [Streptomyces sp. NPDC020192]|uniref:alpha/beta fold hydrolase n=1 Tax=Streptomyces sp. NPDC020192 TaxID=3365066 RepID=UPI0037BAF688
MPGTGTASHPTLLLAHGADGSLSADYGTTRDHLAARFTLIGANHPNSDTTPRATAALHLDQPADQLTAAADAAGIRRFALSGCSLGGTVAIRPAAQHPEQVTSLIPTAPFARRPELASRDRVETE